MKEPLQVLKSLYVVYDEVSLAERTVRSAKFHVSGCCLNVVVSIDRLCTSGNYQMNAEIRNKPHCTISRIKLYFMKNLHPPALRVL